MKKSSEIYLFEEMPIPQAVARMCIPTVLSSLVMILYNLADTYFVGMLNDPVQNAAVTLAFPVLLAFNAVTNLFGVGTSSVMSRSLGHRDYEDVRTSSAIGFYGTLSFGVLFSVGCVLCNNPLLRILGVTEVTHQATADYIFWTTSLGAAPAMLNVVLSYFVRAEGSSIHASVGTMLGCFLNVLLDPVFILPWGLNMGAAGAGCATFLSNCVATLYFLVLITVKGKRTYVCINPKKLVPDKKIIKNIFVVGIPAAIQNLLNVTGLTILNNFVTVYGPVPVAAMGVASKLNQIPMQATLGIGQGVMPLVSYNYSSGNRERMKRSIAVTLGIMVPLSVIITVGYYVWAEPLVRVFMDNDEVVSYGVPFLRGLCLGLTFLCVDFLGVGVFQALGRGKNAFVFAIMRKIILEIPALFILNMIFPLYGLAYAQAFAEVVLAVAAGIIMYRICHESPEKTPLPKR